ncbi:Spo7-domain-containing protein, partial [Lepidopterella palustris CBS 459.81]
TLKTPRPPYAPTDPTSLLPSSPPQIYLNLLILEASLRSQFLTLRARRRQNTFVLTLLGLWILWFTYALFLRPREDGQGVGGSVYWVVDMAEKVAFMGGIVTVILFWATGQWERGVRWPRRWIGVTNRGLRGMNCKIVIMKGPWYRDILSHLSFLIPFGLFFSTPGSSYHYINHSQEKREQLSQGEARHTMREHGTEYAEEDIAPGGDHVKLLLLPKPFSPDFRENWELYRAEYWEKENERRAELRKRVKQHQRQIAKEQGGWLWWTGWRGWERARGLGGRVGDVEKTHHQGHNRSLSAQNSLNKKRRASLRRDRGRDGSHSRSSSRSTTPTPDLDDRSVKQNRDERQRRWSSSTTGSTSDRRRKKGATSTVGIASAGRPTRLTPTGSRPSTPSTGTPAEMTPWQSKRASTLSTTESLS